MCENKPRTPENTAHLQRPHMGITKQAIALRRRDLWAAAAEKSSGSVSAIS